MYNNPFIYNKDTGDYRVGMMAYKFNFDLTKIPNNLFEETYELVMKKKFNINTKKTAKKIVKKYKIDKDTLLQNFPEKIVNEFLDFLGTDKQHRELMLYLIKAGSLVITCDED